MKKAARLRGILPLLMTLLLTPWLGREARAEGYLGAVFGPSFASESLGTVFVDGGHFGVRVAPHFGFGLTFVYENLASDTFNANNTTATVSAVEYLFTLEPLVYPWADLGMFVGAKLGLGFTSISNTVQVGGPSIAGLPTSTAGIAVGVEAGYLLKVENDFGVSLELSSTVVTGPESPLVLTNILFGGNYVF